MAQFKINYEWREKDNGQYKREWRKTFIIVDAVSAKDAIKELKKDAVVEIVVLGTVAV